MQYASADGDKSDTPADGLPPLPAGVRVGRDDPCPFAAAAEEIQSDATASCRNPTHC